VASLEAPGSTDELPAGPPPEVLHDIDVVIEPGREVAFVGPSGAGKTTLASLVPRLYDVTAGAVRIDGHDVRDLTQTSLHAAIGVVAQDPHLFHESVAANLRYARPDATAAELERACRAARIHDVIVALPDGYDTIVGERGYRLSGGEKQRVAIGRALVKDPSFCFADEPTSALDWAHGRQVVELLHAAAHERGATVLVVSHDPRLIPYADQTINLEDGRLTEKPPEAPRRPLRSAS